MRIKILSSAVDDLRAGRLFYESQGQELGSYFLDSLFSDIDSLVLYGGIHPEKSSDVTAFWPSDSPTPSTIRSKKTSSWPGECWTCGVIRTASGKLYNRANHRPQ